jgi:hypothetical protein
MTPDVFKPDAAYFEALANKIVRLSKVPLEDITRVDINCGSGSGFGWVVLKSGERIYV